MVEGGGRVQGTVCIEDEIHKSRVPKSLYLWVSWKNKPKDIYVVWL